MYIVHYIKYAIYLLYLTEDNETNVLQKFQNTRYIFYTPKCRELISLLNGIMTYNNMIMVKGL